MNKYLIKIEQLMLLVSKKLTSLGSNGVSIIVNSGREIGLFFKKNIIVFSIIVLILVIPFLLRKFILNYNLPKKNYSEFVPDYILKTKARIEKENIRMQTKLANKTPKSYYLTINSALNEFTLYKGKILIKTDKCSTGSYILLKNAENQQWMFKTPKGEFRIQGKTTSPVWKKPDWAFVEEGLSVPTVNHYSRFEYGVLGDYALSLGHGYLIHGTLYQRFLGLPVTHGCIRLNDENLELMYNSLSIGSKVYIY